MFLPILQVVITKDNQKLEFNFKTGLMSDQVVNIQNQTGLEQTEIAMPVIEQMVSQMCQVISFFTTYCLVCCDVR